MRGKPKKPIAWIKDGECMICTSHATVYGYPFIRRPGFKTRQLNRIIMLRRYKQPAPCSRHTCDNKRCINPDHIIPGTYADNNKDRAKRGRNADMRGKNNPYWKHREP